MTEQRDPLEEPDHDQIVRSKFRGDIMQLAVSGILESAIAPGVSPVGFSPVMMVRPQSSRSRRDGFGSIQHEVARAVSRNLQPKNAAAKQIAAGMDFKSDLLSNTQTPGGIAADPAALEQRSSR